MSVISIQNISKKYLIRHESASYLTLRDRLAHPIKALGQKLIAKPEEFWALDDVSFEVQPGEVVGIIGPNGSGKSTLLKVLSRITPPTKGQAVLHGRVASLLEVGTGFHPELTGRENIFLSGVILGMTKVEVLKKFDEIVAFAGVEKFLDTPVKYYSSGMGVRLGFAVAAHLNSDIMIIDEVLAVGDAEFQKKCLGKMDDVAKQHGRTILFVSHDMRSIQALCQKGIFLKNGKVMAQGDIGEVISSYTQNTFFTTDNPVKREAGVRTHGPWIESVKLSDEVDNLKNIFTADDCINLEMTINNPNNTKFFHACWTLSDVYGKQVAVGSSTYMDELVYGEADRKIKCQLYPKSLIPGKYLLSLKLYLPGQPDFDNWFNAINFEISTNIINGKDNYPGLWAVSQFLDFKWLANHK